MRIYSATEYCIFSTPFPKSHTTASVRLAHSHVHWHAYLSWQLPSFTGCQTVVKRDSAAHAKALRLVYAEGAHVRQGQEDFGAKAMTGDVFRQFSANVAQPVDLAPALAAAVSVKPSRIGKHAGNGLFLTTSASLCYPLHLLLTGTARVANDITDQEKRSNGYLVDTGFCLTDEQPPRKIQQHGHIEPRKSRRVTQASNCLSDTPRLDEGRRVFLDAHHGTLRPVCVAAFINCSQGGTHHLAFSF